jgi:uncharacterized metal-binding protein
MWRCENCGHLNRDDSKMCEHCRMPRADTLRRRIDEQNQEEIEQIESDMWDEDQHLM